MWDLYVINIGAIFLFMVTMFTIAQLIKDNSIVDIGWGLGFVIIAFVSYFSAEGESSLRQTIVLTLVSLWGIRLFLHLLIRSIGRGEDFRYANFRKQWGKNVRIIAFFRVFMMQGAIMLLLAYPIILVNVADSSGFDLFAALGLIVWLIGFLFQSIGDYQLEHFKKRKKDKEEILKSGLWRYSRHPNYFGEAAMWWGIYLIVLGVPNGWTAFFSAAFINLLLLKVSGVPFLDKRYAENKEYQLYKQETNLFIPWPPKKLNS
jgi:steroid 5-alpha reductase family enzyme